MCQNCYECQEIKILEEKPYDWKKHFLYTLPEQASFFLSVLLGGVIAYHVALGVTGGIVENLPAMCNSL